MLSRPRPSCREHGRESNHQNHFLGLRNTQLTDVHDHPGSRVHRPARADTRLRLTVFESHSHNCNCEWTTRHSRQRRGYWRLPSPAHSEDAALCWIRGPETTRRLLLARVVALAPVTQVHDLSASSACSCLVAMISCRSQCELARRKRVVVLGPPHRPHLHRPHRPRLHPRHNVSAHTGALSLAVVEGPQTQSGLDSVVVWRHSPHSSRVP